MAPRATRTIARWRQHGGETRGAVLHALGDGPDHHNKLENNLNLQLCGTTKRKRASRTVAFLLSMGAGSCGMERGHRV